MKVPSVAQNAVLPRMALEGFLFPALPRVAPYCVRGGVQVVSISPSYPPNTVASL